jgi:hypothetical protein
MLAVSLGCICTPPVPEMPDGGAGGGAAGGGFTIGGGAGGGGAASGCQPATCPPGDGGFCAFTNDGGTPTPSCIDDTCVTECAGGRTCTVVDGGRCLDCGGAVECAMASCTPATRCTFMVAGSGCTGLLDQGSTWTANLQADCRTVISNDAGAILGSWFDLPDGAKIGQFPRLGGSCTGHDLFTNLPRTQFYCPYCSFIAEGCE